VVGEDSAAQPSIAASLSALDFAVSCASDPSRVHEELAQIHPAIVLLDLRTLGRDAIGYCQVLRESWGGVIVVVADRADVAIKVEAFNGGADDFLTEPYGLGELLARFRAILRRAASHNPTTTSVLDVGRVSVDFHRREITVRGQTVHLRPREFELIRLLASKPGQVVPHRALLRAVWGPGHEDAQAYLHVYVSQLRRKIEIDPARPTIIVTEQGHGYRLVP
jgi:two-component system KDP operon response regulator KdpE